MNGIIIVNKPQGFTSHDVVAKLRGILHQKKIGHTGTLDPDATGVLPVLCGCATRLSDIITDETKSYEAVMQLGIVTDTQDISGRVIKETSVTVSEDELCDVVSSFIGDISQIPPMYSAIKVNGKKLYEIARAGREIERESRQIHIDNIEITDISLPYVTIKVNCSKGTYIRTLCNDIGEKLHCGATMTRLVRTKVGRFSLDKAHTLDEIEASPEAYVISLEDALAGFPEFTVEPEHEKALLNGNAIKISWGSGYTGHGLTVLKDSSGHIIGLFKVNDDGAFHPERMLTGN